METGFPFWLKVLWGVCCVAAFAYLINFGYQKLFGEKED